MSYDESSSSSPRKPKTLSPLVPFLVLAASLVTIFAWQISNILSQGDSVKEARNQAEEAIRKREEGIKQLSTANKTLEDLFKELLAASETNENAKAIVQKHGIKQNTPAQAAAAAASAGAAPTP